MAPMDKYTRLVGGVVHGLSCFHSECSGKPVFFFPVIKPGNEGSCIVMTCLSNDAMAGVVCNGSVFWCEWWYLLIQLGGVWKE